jgi:uncharacterized membrane protein
MALEWSSLRPGARAVAVAFTVSGTVHLVRPALFRPLIPPALPAPDAWTIGTGVAELISAVGLMRGAAWAPAATTATLLIVWPGNAWHAVATQRSGAHPVVKAAVWARLPLQVPMMRAAAHPYRTGVTGAG